MSAYTNISAAGICPQCRILMNVKGGKGKDGQLYYYPECPKCGHRGNLLPKKGKKNK